MEITRLSSRLITVFVLLVPLAVTSTEPVAPYQRLVVSGHVTSDSLVRLDQYVVVIVRKSHHDGDVEILRTTWESRHPRLVDAWITFTDTAGAYGLSVTPPHWLFDNDTLAVAVLLPGQTMIVGEPFRLRCVTPEEYKVTTCDDGFFCDSKSGEYVETYTYRYADKDVDI